MKRWLREIFRRNKDKFPDNVDIIFMPDAASTQKVVSAQSSLDSEVDSVVADAAVTAYSFRLQLAGVAELAHGTELKELPQRLRLVASGLFGASGVLDW